METLHQHPRSEFACPFLQLLSLCYELETRLARQVGVSVGELRCLRLFFHENQYTIKEVTKRSGLSSSRLSRILDRLEINGMITRSIDPIDHRIIHVTLTEKGAELVEALRAQVDGLRESVIEDMPVESMETPIRVLREILDSFTRNLQRTRAGTAVYGSKPS